MRVAPGRVHDEAAGVLAHRLGERLWTLVDYDVAPTKFARERCIQRWAVSRVFSALELRNDDLCLETGLALA